MVQGKKSISSSYFSSQVLSSDESEDKAKIKKTLSQANEKDQSDKNKLKKNVSIKEDSVKEKSLIESSKSSSSSSSGYNIWKEKGDK